MAVSFVHSVGARPSGLVTRLSAVLTLAFVLFAVTAPAAAAQTPPSPHGHGSPGDAPAMDPGTTGDQDTSIWDTPWGPLSQYDRNLLINVRWANLWEAPSSDETAQRTTNSKVRTAAEQMMTDHHILDEAVLGVAAKLNVAMPTTPTPLQQSWQQEIHEKTGRDADDAWANLTREAHGTIFMLLATVRAQTKNDMVRDFAQQGVDIVMRHMTLLESTGLVRSTSLYVGSMASAPYQVMPSKNKLFVGIGLAVLVLLGTFAVVRIAARYNPRPRVAE
ncbi:DUF4142 domain-containing protein [Amycolatopsis pithecellobii]|uniref:DUF4142 domain-containing protein n=1 Tax=Amycolatopsis pithecellobii TaxID=664692 RepID=A0A6N7YV40_9PSEU|nr:DUF4142 domain-containing protein [Amycolatopsis pithecellobii]MTD55812.1 DUF4142 domain-containing protein [Amycolatopsis pithecellobii]